MYVVTVKFVIHEEKLSEFLVAMQKQAADSLAFEADCLHFDVCLSENQNNLVFLYEIYKNKAAFDYHLGSQHFTNFNQLVTPWVIDKQVETYSVLQPA